jgi:hypothetical protein
VSNGSFRKASSSGYSVPEVGTHAFPHWVLLALQSYNWPADNLINNITSLNVAVDAALNTTQVRVSSR